MRVAGSLRCWSWCVLFLALSACSEHEPGGSLDPDAASAPGEASEPGEPVVASTAALTATALPPSVPSPACSVAGNALFVVENAGNLDAGDAAALARLRQLGLAVTIKSDEQLVAGDASGKQLVVISSTVGSSVVGPLFRNSAIPIVTWEHALYDELGMTGNGNGDNGSTTGQNKIAMIDSVHPLEDIDAAARRLLDRNRFGKVVLRVSDPPERHS